MQQFGTRLAQERRLKAVRDQRDIGQKEVAAAVGVSRSSLSRWEAGKGQDELPGDETIKRLAEYFGVTPAWMRYGQEPRQLTESGLPPSDNVGSRPAGTELPEQRDKSA